MLPELSAEHPLLLLEFAHHFDQHVWRTEAALADALKPRPEALRDVSEPPRDLAHRHVILDRTLRDRRQLRGGGDRWRLAIRDGPQGDRTLGENVRESAPIAHQFVQLQVQRREQSAADGPMELIADQGWAHRPDRDCRPPPPAAVGLV